MIYKHRTAFAMILVVLFGMTLFYISTDGFRAFTSESARSYELMQKNPAVPSVTLEDSQERTYSFDELAEDKYVLLTFMYTSCTTVCPQLAMNMAEVYDLIPGEYVGKEIVFLSISFDPTKDDPETLAKYRRAFGSDGQTWRMARIKDQEELERLLEKLGVVVIPNEYGEFQHNAAFYLVGKEGRLQEVMDFTNVEAAAGTVTAILEKGENRP
ncbi:SCO family protein [Salibacterium aidingense]|uniref:SCO family protein n=1 Tax=Salibacterium aidingense TaxID=384933 RepID=UPI000408612D|nr:SCO family protein [Salibacterium aidingense]